MGKITITIEDYKRFLKLETRIEAFAAFVKKEKYSISRDICGAYLGFEVNDAGND